LENSQTEHAQIEPIRTQDAYVKGMLISNNELAVWCNEKILIYNIHTRRVTNLLGVKDVITNCIISLGNKILFDETDSLIIWDHTTNQTSTLSFVADKTILYGVYSVDDNHFILQFKNHAAVYSLQPLKQINMLPLAYRNTHIFEMWNATNIIIFVSSVIKIIDVFTQELLVEKNIGAYLHALHKLDNNSMIIASRSKENDISFRIWNLRTDQISLFVVDILPAFTPFWFKGSYFLCFHNSELLVYDIHAQTLVHRISSCTQPDVIDMK
jgi:hypothetical protein